MAFKRYRRRKWLKSPIFFHKYKFLYFLDADVRATLNSYQYLKRLLADRLEKQAQTMAFVCLI
jgi:hypothetical protein